MLSCLLFFFNDTATTEIYTLSLHDALPISLHRGGCGAGAGGHRVRRVLHRGEKGRHGHVRTRARGGGGTRGARGALGALLHPVRIAGREALLRVPGIPRAVSEGGRHLPRAVL